jgi:hypothetical protein
LQKCSQIHSSGAVKPVVNLVSHLPRLTARTQRKAPCWWLLGLVKI